MSIRDDLKTINAWLAGNEPRKKNTERSLSERKIENRKKLREKESNTVRWRRWWLRHKTQWRKADKRRRRNRARIKAGK